MDKQVDEEANCLLNKDDSQAIQNQLNEIMKQGEAGLMQVEQFVQLRNSPGQNALFVLGLQLATASLCTLLINSITPIQWVMNFIPKFNLLNFLLYVVFCGIFQFGTAFWQKTPWNFLMFLLHSAFKIIFFIFYGVQYPLNRLDVYYFFLIFGIAYVWLLLKDKESGHADLSVKGNFFKIAFIEIVLAEYLCLLSNAGVGPMVYIPILGILYTFFLLLVVQRFDELKYLDIGNNSIFLGAAQIDADLIFFCPLAWRHIKPTPKDGLPVQLPNGSQEQAPQNQEQAKDQQPKENL